MVAAAANSVVLFLMGQSTSKECFYKSKIFIIIIWYLNLIKWFLFFFFQIKWGIKIILMSVVKLRYFNVFFES